MLVFLKEHGIGSQVKLILVDVRVIGLILAGGFVGAGKDN